MIVKVEFTVDTVDYGQRKFKKEIENLLRDVDPDTQLLEFDMYEIVRRVEIDV